MIATHASHLTPHAARRLLTLAACVLAAACAPPDAATPSSSRTPPDSRPTPQLRAAVEGEPRTLVPSVGAGAGDASEHLFELVHQSLMTFDHQARPLPRVARELPSLERGTWRVNPDGTMETVWRLRPDVRWHDDHPLTANDVIFSWRLFSEPVIPVTTRRAARLIDRMESPDPHTVVMHWRTRYAFADQLSGFDLTLLPSHLLEAAFELRREQFSTHPYWRNEFVGLGPYRVDRWIAGSSLELRAFDRYFLGRPLIAEISVRFLPDDNTALAALLSGNLDILLPRRAAQGVVRTARQQWKSPRDGIVSVLPGYRWLFLAPQFASPYPEELLDIRVRRALAHALDRDAVAEAIAGDRTLAAELWVPRADARYPLLAEQAAHYEYNRERARDLFRDLGWHRETADDVLVKHGQRFEIELSTTAEWQSVAAVVADYWRDVGVPVRERVLALGAVVDREARAAYSGVELAASVPNLALLDGRLHSGNTPGPENQWVGANRGRYTSQELDVLLDRLWLTFERDERERVERDIARHISTELPLVGLFFYPAMAIVRGDIRDYRPPETVAPVGRLSVAWNAHQWERV